jgi:hypothetical protein
MLSVSPDMITNNMAKLIILPFLLMAGAGGSLLVYRLMLQMWR